MIVMFLLMKVVMMEHYIGAKDKNFVVVPQVFNYWCWKMCGCWNQISN